MNKLPLAAKMAIGAVICLIVGFLSGFSTAGSISTWYAELNKPIFNPPNWLFGPAWTVLYILMGLAAGLVWHQGVERPIVKKH